MRSPRWPDLLVDLEIAVAAGLTAPWAFWVVFGPMSLGGPMFRETWTVEDLRGLSAALLIAG